MDNEKKVKESTEIGLTPNEMMSKRLLDLQEEMSKDSNSDQLPVNMFLTDQAQGLVQSQESQDEQIDRQNATGIDAFTNEEKAAIELDIMQRMGYYIDDPVRRAFMYKYTQDTRYFPKGFELKKPHPQGNFRSLQSLFLYDHETNKLAHEIRTHINEELVALKKAIARQKIMLNYSFYNGEYHHRTVKVRVTDTVSRFLQRVQHTLLLEFTGIKLRDWTSLIAAKKKRILDHRQTFFSFLHRRDNFTVENEKYEKEHLFNLDIARDVSLRVPISIEHDPIVVIDQRLFEIRSRKEPFCAWTSFEAVEFSPDPTISQSSDT
eukprot:CAMPEP_0167748784 /NCGR_PEP_ID=MMETSP0110_2-20121227/5033_1 /TAXON_ID=629695 /ORGANISM="Gymnochlora sp., Strain CCMP2014" /LENGTH=319 /DNA_ID=CAMNT_0007633843 /DNA_START=1409 /DNA_END=2365 /DNA_ORIENTATION=+